MSAPAPTPKFVVHVVGVLCLITAPLWMYLLLFPEGYPYLTGIFVFLAALVVDFGLILHVSRDDGELRRIMTVGLFLKMLGAAAYLAMIMKLYNGGGDMFGYYQWGSKFASNIREYGEIGVLKGEMGFSPTGEANGTTSISVLTGLMFALTGPTLTGAIVIFSSVAYWGSFLFWKAFKLAFPESNVHLAAMLLFFMPSFVFWASAIGKDAPIFFCIALVAYGLCQVIYAARVAALFQIALGIVGAAFIRPHIAGILGLSLCTVFLLGKNKAGLPGVVARVLLVPVLIAGSYYAVNNAKAQLGVGDAQDAEKVATGWSKATQYGGSSFQSGSFLARVALSPTLPFRPFPWEVGSVQTALASAEGMFLALLFWRNRKSLKQSLVQWRSDPFTAFILFFSLETSAALASAFSNFGLLARERVMFTPLLILLIPACPYVKRQLATQGERMSLRALPARRGLSV